MRLRVQLLLAVLVASVVLPGAAAETASPVIFEATTGHEHSVLPGEAVSVTWNLTNLNTKTAYAVTGTADLPRGWSMELSPRRLVVEAAGEATMQASFLSSELAAAQSEVLVTFTVMNTETGDVFRVEEPFVLHLQREASVFKVFANPLPSPLDNAYGVFLIEFGFWCLLALAAIFTGDSFIRYLTRRASNVVSHAIVQKVRVPLFTLVLLLGFRDAVTVLPDNALTVFAENILAVLAIGIVGAYLVYRVVDAALYYYKVEIAPRTATTMDDVLTPALRKLAQIGVYVFSIAYILKNLFNVDPGVFFGAAGIAGLVLAFAAQETISNFFSGIFLLVDRPFAEGHDIRLETGEVTRVEKIGLRSTRLYHYRNHELIIVPNNDLASKRIVNLTDPDQRYKVMIDVGVAYGSDVEKVKSALVEAASSVEGVITDPEDPPIVLFQQFADSSLNFTLRFGVNEYKDRFRIASEIREKIDALFRRESIEIPFPQRTLWIKREDGDAAARSLHPEGAPRREPAER